MCSAVSVLKSELPEAFANAHRLDRRLYCGDGAPEYRFYYREPRPVLPVVHQGRVVLARWGNRDGRGPLPPTGWTWKQSVAEGKWGQVAAEPVQIVANQGWELGVWFVIERGVEGVLVHAEDGTPVVYMVCEPPTRYYRVMTRSDRMPVLIGQTI